MISLPFPTWFLSTVLCKNAQIDRAGSWKGTILERRVRQIPDPSFQTNLSVAGLELIQNILWPLQDANLTKNLPLDSNFRFSFVFGIFQNKPTALFSTLHLPHLYAHSFPSGHLNSSVPAHWVILFFGHQYNS